MKYHYKITQDEHGYKAVCIELFGCFAYGVSKNEVLIHLKDAVDRVLEKGDLSPLPNENLYEFEELEPAPDLALGLLLRHARHSFGMSNREMAEKLGLRTAKDYERLEKRAKPTHERLLHLQQTFPDFNFLRIVS